MENRKIRVAITHGDTNGIGYELIFKALEDPMMRELCTPIIYGSPKVATYHRKALDIQANFTIINNAENAQEGRINMLTTFEEEIKVELGEPSEESGNAALKAIDRALADWQNGLVDVIVTAPVDNNEAFNFSGQTRYIEDHTESYGKSMTILTGERLRMALANVNTPMKHIAETVTKENIIEKVKVIHESMRRDFRISNPRIAVLSLNPKAGDNGLTGSEEVEIIKPAIEELSDNGIQVYGPYAADEFFTNGYYSSFDATLAMHYEQGIIPFNMIDNNEGARFTAGLPLIRTAPLQNASFNIAGGSIADATSMRNAIFLAIDIFRHRAEYDEPLDNPLKKLYKERRDENEKTRFNIPKKNTNNESAE